MTLALISYYIIPCYIIRYHIVDLDYSVAMFDPGYPPPPRPGGRQRGRRTEFGAPPRVSPVHNDNSDYYYYHYY